MNLWPFRRRATTTIPYLPKINPHPLTCSELGIVFKTKRGARSAAKEANQRGARKQGYIFKPVRCPYLFHYHVVSGF